MEYPECFCWKSSLHHLENAICKFWADTIWYVCKQWAVVTEAWMDRDFIFLQRLDYIFQGFQFFRCFFSLNTFMITKSFKEGLGDNLIKPREFWGNADDTYCWISHLSGQKELKFLSVKLVFVRSNYEIHFD